MQEVHSSIRMGRVTERQALDVLGSAFSKSGLELPQSMSQAEHILVKSGFRKRARVFRVLGSKNYTKALGIPSQREVLRRMIGPHYADVPHGRVLSAMYLGPRSGPAHLFGVPEHPAYSILNEGQYLGRLENPLKLSELAPEDFAEWMAKEKAKHEWFRNMSKHELAELYEVLETNPHRRSMILSHFDLRTGLPTEPHWNRSVQLGKHAVRINEDALRIALKRL